MRTPFPGSQPGGLRYLNLYERLVGPQKSKTSRAGFLEKKRGPPTSLTPGSVAAISGQRGGPFLLISAPPREQL
jgi:hypothetical protein